MRWSIIRLVTIKELRDLLRDRRTIMLIVVLPFLLYPLFGLTAYLFAMSMIGQPMVIGVCGLEHLNSAAGVLPKFPIGDKQAEPEADAVPSSDPFQSDLGQPSTLQIKSFQDEPNSVLTSKRADAVLVIPENFVESLKDTQQKPTLKILGRDGDEKSKLAVKRLTTLVNGWEEKLRDQRFEEKGLPRDYHEIFVVDNPFDSKPLRKKAADELRDTFARVFPFILMMWLVAGAIQPAVDMTAGEKERGTMETLLISPAERSEIVLGKFFANTVFSFTSVIWNVFWLTGSALLVELVFGFPIINRTGILICVILGLPLAMLFSGVSLALGVFARSSKEGQYYLLPLMLGTMPLAFWAMMPGGELGPWNCWVPVTGAMLLQRRLLSVAADPIPWTYYPLVLGSLFVWVAAALSLAIWQFRRESVLFRETGPERTKGIQWFFRKPS